MRRLFWDLDGTIGDPREGIVGSVLYALVALGIEPDRGSVERFIGPPLRDGFRRHYGLEGERLEEAVRLYRRRFDAVGWRECRLYPGMTALLAALDGRRLPMVVATSKPTVFAERVLGRFGIRARFSAVCGATLDGRIAHKRDVLRLAAAGLTVAERAGAVMIGDHPNDIEAAHAEGMRAVAVGWGYGLPEELARAAPDATADSVPALARLLGAEGEEGPVLTRSMQQCMKTTDEEAPTEA